MCQNPILQWIFKLHFWESWFDNLYASSVSNVILIKNLVMSKRGVDELMLSPDSDPSFLKKVDMRSTPNKEEIMSDPTSNDLVLKLQKTAPEWFVEAFSYLIKELNILKCENETVNEVKGELKTEIKSLETKVLELESTIKQQDEKISGLEIYSRRDNLIIEGIPESPNEDIKSKILTFFVDKLGVSNGKDISISRVHRLGKPPHTTPHSVKRPRSVIVRFHYFPDREKIWKSSWKLKDRSFHVREDFPDSVRENRAILLPCLKAAKKDHLVQRCSLIGDTLWIDGRKYTVSNIEDLPQRLKWTNKGQRYFSKCDSTFFFGRGSFLSNHHKSPFEHEGTTYLCSEQYYLQSKCLYFNDEVTASSIMRLDDPGKMKSLSHKIKGLEEKKWETVYKSFMEKACFLKFTKSHKLRNLLISTSGNLVEANHNDQFFSCGLALSDPNILDKSRWTGKNILGEILTNLRELLKHQ